MNLNDESGSIERVNTLTFDIFGTVLDLAGSLIPSLDKLLQQCNVPESLTGADVWNHWRLRQRLEQYQDNLIMLGHSGYLEVKKRALLYTLRLLKIEFFYYRGFFNQECVLNSNKYLKPISPRVLNNYGKLWPFISRCKVRTIQIA